MGLATGLLAAHAVDASGFLAFMATTVSVVALALIHEFGHAFVGRALGLRVHAIVLHGGGGMCFVEMAPDKHWTRMLVLSGGVLAQAALLAVSLVAVWQIEGPTFVPVSCMLFVFTAVNAAYLLGSLIPYKGNDGSQLLAALRQLWRRSTGGVS